MTGRHLPWYDRRQATLVSEAARRAGFDASARISGHLWIRAFATTPPAEVADLTFSVNSGEFLHGVGIDVSGTQAATWSKRDMTSRQAVDDIVAWFHEGRPTDEVRARKRAEARARHEAAQAAAQAAADPRPLAPVTELASRRRPR